MCLVNYVLPSIANIFLGNTGQLNADSHTAKTVCPIINDSIKDMMASGSGIKSVNLQLYLSAPASSIPDSDTRNEETLLRAMRLKWSELLILITLQTPLSKYMLYPYYALYATCMGGEYCGWIWSALRSSSDYITGCMWMMGRLVLGHKTWWGEGWECKNQRSSRVTAYVHMYSVKWRQRRSLKLYTNLSDRSSSTAAFYVSDPSIGT